MGKNAPKPTATRRINTFYKHGICGIICGGITKGQNMAERKNIFQKMRDGIANIGKKQSVSPRRSVDSNYKIKYDGSIQEIEALGLANEMGVVLDREEYNRYNTIVESRRKIRELPDFEKLKQAGIVNEDGEVLDQKRYSEYTQAQFDSKYGFMDKTR